jgi:hypothetical protein
MVPIPIERLSHFVRREARAGVLHATLKKSNLFETAERECFERARL